METESQASFSIGKETGELAVMETIRMDDMDFFEMVHHFFTVRGVIQTRCSRRGRLQRREAAGASTDGRERAAVRALSGNDGNLVLGREGDKDLYDLEISGGDGY
ncbi:hypothetical protein Tco_1077476 [Tanacetum coccineum]